MKLLQLTVTVLLLVANPRAVWPDEPDQPAKPAAPARHCAVGGPLPMDEMRSQIEQQFHESIIMTGINAAGQFVALFATVGGETWTAITVDASTRLACVTGFGTSLTIINQGAPS